MKEKLILIFAALTLLFVAACDDETTGPISTTGTIFVDSTPQGAEIWLDGVNTNSVTPATIEAEEGIRTITLVLDGYSDLEFDVSVIAGEQSFVSENTLMQLGMLNVSSTPAGADIYINGENTGEVTPSSFTLEDDNYFVVLKLESYADTTYLTQIANGGTSIVDIVLQPLYTRFSTPVRIWETTGTTVEQPSGLDLSSGMAFGTSDAANRDSIDIYYFSSSDGSTFLVQSSHLNANMNRETFFKVGSSSNLNDGTDSPVKDSGWGNSMSDRESNYVFLYDEDGHYSKLKIASFGGGSGPGDPAWVELEWIYSQAVDNVLF